MRLFLATIVFIAGTMPAAAQWLERPWSGIPRTADGKPNLTAPAPRGPDGKPDLTGLWNGPVPRPTLDAAKGAILASSAAAAVLGFAFLAAVLPRKAG